MKKLKRKKKKPTLHKLFPALFESKFFVNTLGLAMKKSLGSAAVFAFTIVLMSVSSNSMAANPACGTPTNHWLPWEGLVYKGEVFIQRNECGVTRGRTGTKDHIWWNMFDYVPAPSTVCKNRRYTQTLYGPGGYSTQRHNWGTSLGTSWTPARNQVCAGQGFVQTSNCGVFRSNTGTKQPGAFTPATSTKACGTSFTQFRTCGSSRTAIGTAPSNDWTPATGSICVGQSFTQTRSCGSSRTVLGTKPAGAFFPATDTVACGVSFTQTRECGVERQALGTMDSSDWTPAANSICVGQVFTQTRSCGDSRQMNGSKTSGECADPDGDWDGDGISNSEDIYPFQHATQCVGVSA